MYIHKGPLPKKLKTDSGKILKVRVRKANIKSFRVDLLTPTGEIEKLNCRIKKSSDKLIY